MILVLVSNSLGPYPKLAISTLSVYSELLAITIKYVKYQCSLLLLSSP